MMPKVVHPFREFCRPLYQPRMFYRSQTPIEQAHIASAIVFELSKVETPYIRERMVAQLLAVDESLAKRVADGLGMTELPQPIAPTVPVQDLPLSPAIQLIGKAKPTLEGRKVGILIAEGSNAEMLINTKMRLLRPEPHHLWSRQSCMSR